MKNVSSRATTACLALILLPSSAAAQMPDTSRRPCEENPGYRAMDFWVGEWEVATAAGDPAGSSRIELVLGTCIVFENWTGANGYEGKSFNLFHPTTSRWEQVWVDNMGGITRFEGEARDGNIIYRAEVEGRDGAPASRRVTFFPQGPDRVRQLGERSKDGGKTWTVDYDLLYQRRK